MPLQDQVIPIHYGSGVSTNTDERLVVAGKMLRLENAVFNKEGAINKRNGYTRLPVDGPVPPISATQMVRAYQDELVIASDKNLYSLNDGDDGWIAKGEYIPVEVKSQLISADTYPERMPSASIVGTHLIYGFQERVYNTNVDPAVVIAYPGLVGATDLITGLSVTAGDINTYFNTFGSLKTCRIGPSTIGYFGLTPANQIGFLTFTIDSSGRTGDIQTVVATDPAGYALTYDGATGRILHYDCATTATGAVIAYSRAATFTGAPNDIVIKTINTLGVVVNTATITGAGAVGPVSVVVGTDQRIWVYYGDATSNAFFRLFTSALVAVPPGGVITAPASGREILQITAVGLTPTTQRVMVSYLDRLPDFPCILIVTATAAGGAIPAQPQIQGVDIAGKAYLYQGKSYFLGVFRSQNQGSYILLDASNNSPSPISRIAFGKALSTRTPSSYIAEALDFGSGKFGYVVPRVTAIDVVAGIRSEITETTLYTFDYQSEELFQGFAINNLLLLNGGMVWAYDGQIASEYGFLASPEILSATRVAGGGSLSAGAYEYAVTFKWVDNRGNVHESAPSTFTVNGVLAGDHVDLLIQYPTLTRKLFGGDVRLNIYRSEANLQTLYLVDDGRVAAPSSLPAQYTHSDGVADSAITSNNLLYTDGGILPNDAPPPTLTMTVHSNRVWLINSEDRNELWYSKTMINDEAILFAGDLTYPVDQVGGLGVALASMDEKLVVLEELQPLIIVGDGANDAGEGSTLSSPQPVPTDTGCLTSLGVAVFPMGVIFKSPKGIYLLDRGLSVKYLGVEVDAYNSLLIKQTTMDYGRKQIRFLTKNGLCLVYDYLMNQWSTFTNHQGVSADIFQGKYVYSPTLGAPLLETDGFYKDDQSSFAVLAQTAWLALASVQGFQRVKKFESLGTFQNGVNSTHAIRVSAAYDFVSTFSPPIPYVFGLAAASGVFQYRERLPRQKCDTISLLIEEVVSNDPSESIVLTDMSFEAGVKKGLNKVPQTGMVS